MDGGKRGGSIARYSSCTLGILSVGGKKEIAFFASDLSLRMDD